MQKISTIFLLVGALALSACNNPNGFGKGGANGGAGGAGGISGGALGDPSNPNSPAYFAQTLGDTVRFVVDQSTLTPEAQATLTKQAAWMVGHPAYTATIEGHADEQGTEEYNLALGARRASAVQQFLIAQGVMGNRLKTVSYGKLRPIATCADESCFSQNRRAVTVLGAGAGV
jgi:peptidoglycan-associated lipoprotein